LNDGTYQLNNRSVQLVCGINAELATLGQITEHRVEISLLARIKLGNIPGNPYGGTVKYTPDAVNGLQNFIIATELTVQLSFNWRT
jgi:hypothetical protein